MLSFINSFSPLSIHFDDKLNCSFYCEIFGASEWIIIQMIPFSLSTTKKTWNYRESGRRKQRCWWRKLLKIGNFLKVQFCFLFLSNFRKEKLDHMRTFLSTQELREILHAGWLIRFLRAADWDTQTAEGLVSAFWKFLNDFSDCLERSSPSK